MGLFGFGKSYTRDDLQKEITKLERLYIQGMGGGNPQLKRELASQLSVVLNICRKGNFYGGEMVDWCGSVTSLRNVTPPVQVMIEMM